MKSPCQLDGDSKNAQVESFDVFLRKRFAEESNHYLQDDGFTQRVMAALPEKPRISVQEARWIGNITVLLLSIAVTAKLLVAQGIGSFMLSFPISQVFHHIGLLDVLAVGVTLLGIFLGGFMVWFARELKWF